MAARTIDGTAIAQRIRAELAEGVASFTGRTGRKPGLGIVLVGERPDSQIYVRNKLKAAGEVGIDAKLSALPADATLDEILSVVRTLNADSTTDGILVQSPLPGALGPGALQQIFDLIEPPKDVDGVTPVNVGRLVQNRAELVSCTPAGIIELLRRSHVQIAGARAVVIGRSEIVGKPISLLLLHRHATVTICHSRTTDLATIASTADILVAALGKPGFVRRTFVKPGATVIDVGINRVTDPAAAKELLGETSPRLADFARRGSVIVGDVHREVLKVAGALTPVPGGVGPMTIAMVLANTLKAAELRTGGGPPGDRR
jgi:methylenetetrahydrofolate dehydrogenase (NADP+) / methenyltetrahydrofolate cyclohydrolase